MLSLNDQFKQNGSELPTCSCAVHFICFQCIQIDDGDARPEPIAGAHVTVAGGPSRSFVCLYVWRRCRAHDNQPCLAQAPDLCICLGLPTQHLSDHSHNIPPDSYSSARNVKAVTCLINSPNPHVLEEYSLPLLTVTLACPALQFIV